MPKTPWGISDSSEFIRDGIMFFATPGHGGFRCETKLYRERCQEKKIPYKPASDYDTRRYTWFEEDGEWAYLAIAFPEHFSEDNLKIADRSIRNYDPDYWEKWQKCELLPGESRVKDERRFMEEHKNDFMVISASYLPGTRCASIVMATEGGRKDGKAAEKMFLVQSEREAAFQKSQKIAPSYVVQPEDIEVEAGRAGELVAAMHNDKERHIHEWRPVDFHISEDAGIISLTCERLPHLGKEGMSEEKMILEVDAEEWGKREPWNTFIAKQNESGEWAISKVCGDGPMQWLVEDGKLTLAERQSPDTEWSIKAVDPEEDTGPCPQ